MRTYKHQALTELAQQQVRFAPPSKRLDQLAKAEELLTDLDATKEYPYQFVCFKITDYRPDAYPDLVIPGQDLIHDLGMFIAELADSMPALRKEEMREPVLTLEEFSRKLNVTPKTINRWRMRGLIGLPILHNGRRQVGFLPSLTDPFLAAHQERFEKSGKFSQLTEAEKDEILRRARRFVRVGIGNLSQVSRRIARKLDRATETVRYTIKNFDRRHPDQALFPAVTGPFDPSTKQLIFSSFRRGISVDTLAKRFQKTRSSMYRVINEIRAQRLLDQSIAYIPNPAFDNPALEAEMRAGAKADDRHVAKALRLQPVDGGGNVLCGFIAIENPLDAAVRIGAVANGTYVDAQRDEPETSEFPAHFYRRTAPAYVMIGARV